MVMSFTSMYTRKNQIVYSEPKTDFKSFLLKQDNIPL